MPSIGHFNLRYCEQGHVITSFDPSFQGERCAPCGMKFVDQCPSCNAPLDRRWRSPTYVGGKPAQRPPRPQQFCTKCGKPFPWQVQAERDAGAAPQIDAGKRGDAAGAVSGEFYHNCTVIKDSKMRDSFQAGQAGAMGPHAKAENMTFIQVLREAIGESSLGQLADELERLRAAMLSESKTADQDAAVAAVAGAEAAAKKGDASGVLTLLKQAGKWALEVATKIGTEVAGKAIQKSMGL